MFLNLSGLRLQLQPSDGLSFMLYLIFFITESADK